MSEIILKDLVYATKWQKAITKTQRKELEEQTLKLLNFLLALPQLEDMFYEGVVLGQMEGGNFTFELVIRKNRTLETVHKMYADTAKVTLKQIEKKTVEPDNYPKELEIYNITDEDIQFLISLF